jgi:hypothetical protein
MLTYTIHILQIVIMIMQSTLDVHTWKSKTQLLQIAVRIAKYP